MSQKRKKPSVKTKKTNSKPTESVKKTANLPKSKKQKDFFDSLSSAPSQKELLLKPKKTKKVVSFKNLDTAQEGIITSHDDSLIEPNRTNTKIKGRITLANKITLFRLLLIIPFIVFMTIPLTLPAIDFQTGSYGTIVPSYFRESFKGISDSWFDLRLLCFLAGAIIFILAMFTDWLDGYVARKRNQVTTFGKVFDPIADKLIVLSALIFLSVYGIVPIWLSIIIILRDLCVDGMRIFLASKGNVLPAIKTAKLKTVFLSVGIIVLFFVAPIWSFETLNSNLFSPVFPGIMGISHNLNFIVDSTNFYWFLNWIVILPLIVATYFSIHSGIVYFKKAKKHLNLRINI